MAVGYSKYLKIIYALGDLVLLNGSFFFVSLIFANYKLTVDVTFLAQFIYINFFWVLIGMFINITDIDRTMRFEQMMSVLIRYVVLHFTLLVVFIFFFSKTLLPLYNLFWKYSLFAPVFFAWRFLMRWTLRFLRIRGLNFRRVIIVGGGELSEKMNNTLQKHPEMGYRMLGVFVDTNDHRFNGLVKGPIEKAKEFALANNVDEIYCSISEIQTEQVSELVRFSDQNLIRFKIIPDFRGFHNKKVHIDFYESVPVLSVRHEPLESMLNRFLKRTFDILFSLIILMFVFPVVFLFVVIPITMSSRGPVFFRQKRSGFRNQTFDCLKFRTMQVNSEADTLQATQDDLRITPIGKFLRRTSLDELPQFINVLFGNMSVVGPRPHMLKHTEQYSALIDSFMVRHFIKPGITGWAQIHGLRGETKSTMIMEKRVEFDVWYIENWSLMLDFKIIFYTVKNLFAGKLNGS